MKNLESSISKLIEELENTTSKLFEDLENYESEEEHEDHSCCGKINFAVPQISIKVKALELAMQSHGNHGYQDILDAANRYYNFLTNN